MHVRGPASPLRAGGGPLLTLVKSDKLAFLVVGSINTAVGTLWFVLIYTLLGGSIGYMSALIIAHLVAVVTAFFLYRTLVFRVKGRLFGDLIRFWLVQLNALMANLVLLPLAVEVASIPPIPAQFTIITLTATITYLGQKHFAFRRTPVAPISLPPESPKDA